MKMYYRYVNIKHYHVSQLLFKKKIQQEQTWFVNMNIYQYLPAKSNQIDIGNIIKYVDGCPLKIRVHCG